MGPTAKDDPTSSGLSDTGRGATVHRPPNPADLRTAAGEVDPAKLAAALRKDRLRLKLSWPAYAAHVGVPMATLYKIARKAAVPQELTVQKILDHWTTEAATT